MKLLCLPVLLCTWYQAMDHSPTTSSKPQEHCSDTTSGIGQEEIWCFFFTKHVIASCGARRKWKKRFWSCWVHSPGSRQVAGEIYSNKYKSFKGKSPLGSKNECLIMVPWAGPRLLARWKKPISTMGLFNSRSISRREWLCIRYTHQRLLI